MVVCMNDKAERLTLWVQLVNDDGNRWTVVAFGDTVDEAVASAERNIRALTDDDSYTMNEWGAA